jgi:hypothetical protein
MIIDAQDNVVGVVCDSKMFNIKSILYEAQSLVGRATRVWMVEYNQMYILKDTWVKESCPVPEYEHLQHIVGVPGVPVFFCWEDVTINGRLLSSSTIRLHQLTTQGGGGRSRRESSAQQSAPVLPAFVPSGS